MASIVFLLVAASASAQVLTPPPPQPTPTPTPTVEPLKQKPLPVIVIDARGGFAGLGQDPTTAADVGVLATDMSGKARTFVVGAHLYLFREGGFKLGIGAEAIRGVAANQALDSTGNKVGPIIRRRLEGLSGQLSLNFGKGKGWSYITAGGGPMKFETYLDDAKPTRAGETTLNYGGGARWSFASHLAFNLDLRMYLTRPVEATLDGARRARKRIALLSAGISIK
jgi:hypothetical protein